MKDIVVGVDGSPASSRALAVAAVEAERAGATLRAVHGYYTPMWVRGGPRDHYDVLETPQEGTEYAEKLVASQIEDLYARQPLLKIDLASEVLEGEPREQLLAISERTDLLVVGSRGVSRVRGLILGSVAQFLLSKSACPLLLVPAEGDDPVPPRRVVVGVDGSTASRAALRWALDAARRHSCPLVVLHAWLITRLPGMPDMRYVSELPEYEKVCQEWLEAEVKAALPERAGVEIRYELVHATPATALRSALGTDDLLVVGRRGAGGFTGLALGSVAAQCAHHAKGLLVVVPSHDVD